MNIKNISLAIFIIGTTLSNCAIADNQNPEVALAKAKKEVVMNLLPLASSDLRVTALSIQLNSVGIMGTTGSIAAIKTGIKKGFLRTIMRGSTGFVCGGIVGGVIAAISTAPMIIKADQIDQIFKKNS